MAFSIPDSFLCIYLYNYICVFDVALKENVYCLNDIMYHKVGLEHVPVLMTDYIRLRSLTYG